MAVEIYNTRSAVDEAKKNLRTARFLVSGAQWPILLAAMAAVVLKLIDPIVSPMLTEVGFSAPDDDDYVSFLSAVSGIGGVFIGLYYAAISSIGSSIYARVPNNIRDILANERIGNVYMSGLAFVTFLGVVLISFRLLGGERLLVAVPVMTLASGVGIVAFVQLGQRAFDFFDPTKLVSNITVSLLKSVESVTAARGQWGNPSFQLFAYKQASKSLEAYETVARVSEAEDHWRGASFVQYSMELVRLLNFYEHRKCRIPTESRWYEQRYSHKDWYRSNASEVGVARQTGTGLQPTISVDQKWLEKRLVRIVYSGVQSGLQAGRHKNVVSLSEAFCLYLETLSRNGQLGYAYKLLGELFDAVYEVLSKEEAPTKSEGEKLEVLALVETIASAPVKLAIASFSHWSDLDLDRFRAKLRQLNWPQTGAIYSGAFPEYMLPKLEWLGERLRFELEADGEIISPDWYQSEILLRTSAEVFSTVADDLFVTAQKLYEGWAKRLAELQRPWLVAAVTSREWEYWHKIQYHQDSFFSTWAVYLAHPFNTYEGWPEVDQGKLLKNAESRKQVLIGELAKQSVVLAFADRGSHFPDYAGQFLFTAQDEVVDCLATGDAVKFKELFPKVFYASLMRFDELFPKRSGAGPGAVYAVSSSAGPLLDVVDLSGYAKLMSEFHREQAIWACVRETWDGYFDLDGGTQRARAIGGVLAITGSHYSMDGRSMDRMNWGKKILHKLHDVVSEEVVRGMLSFSTKKVVNHESALVRVCAGSESLSLVDGIEIFVVEYLRSRSGGGKEDFGHRGRRLDRSLEFERRDV